MLKEPARGARGVGVATRRRRGVVVFWERGARRARRARHRRRGRRADGRRRRRRDGCGAPPQIRLGREKTSGNGRRAAARTRRDGRPRESRARGRDGATKSGRERPSRRVRRATRATRLERAERVCARFGHHDRRDETSRPRRFRNRGEVAYATRDGRPSSRAPRRHCVPARSPVVAR